VPGSAGGSVMIDAANYLATETFRDGRTITIRAQRPEDRDSRRAALAWTSAETRYFRFFAENARFPKKKRAERPRDEQKARGRSGPCHPAVLLIARGARSCSPSWSRDATNDEEYDP